MTREEAIEYWNNHYEVGNVEQNEAVYMAIMALKFRSNENECRTCEYGEVYNDAWCRCQHPVIKGCRVKISGGCEVEKLEKVRKEYMKMRKESE